jgi:hypothetical protein
LNTFFTQIAAAGKDMNANFRVRLAGRGVDLQ